MVIWTTRLPHVCGGGTTHITSASTRHTTTATCLFVTILRTFAGIYFLGDHREGLLGEIQKLDAEEVELDEDEDE